MLGGMLGALLGTVLPAAAPAVEITGRLQQELAYRLAGDKNELTKGLAFVQVEGVEWLGPAGRLTVIVRMGCWLRGGRRHGPHSC